MLWCPHCSREVVAQRCDGGAIGRKPCGFIHFLAARCPYPSCAEPVFAATELPLDLPAVLIGKEGMTQLQRRSLGLEAFESILGVFFGLLVVLGPLLAVRAAFEQPACSPGRAIVLLGAIFMIVPAAFLLASGLTRAIVDLGEAQRRFLGLDPDGDGGLRLTRVPNGYRD